jgi:hypothetical protein
MSSDESEATSAPGVDVLFEVKSDDGKVIGRAVVFHDPPLPEPSAVKVNPTDGQLRTVADTAARLEAEPA